MTKLKNGGHATYGMFFPEPSYDDIPAKVVKILEGQGNPISTTVPTTTPTNNEAVATVITLHQ